MCTGHNLRTFSSIVRKGVEAAGCLYAYPHAGIAIDLSPNDPIDDPTNLSMPVFLAYSMKCVVQHLNLSTLSGATPRIAQRPSQCLFMQENTLFQDTGKS